MRSQDQILEKIRELKRQKIEYFDLVEAGNRRNLTDAVQRQRQRKLSLITAQLDTLIWVINGSA